MSFGRNAFTWLKRLAFVSSFVARPAHCVTEQELLDAVGTSQNFLDEDIVASMQTTNDIGKKIEELQSEVEGLQTLYAELEMKEKEVDRLVALANAMQIETLMARLNDVLAKEKHLREVQRTGKLAGAETSGEMSAPSPSSFVHMRELKDPFETANILASSEATLQSWVVSLIEEELEAYKARFATPESESNGTDAAENTEECPSALEVVQDVQVALTNFSQDGIGLVDHMQGASIVHSMTSPTYVPPPMNHELLGNVWWRRFIPEDWESLLPSGWQDWDTRIPSYIQHTLNLNGAATAPPEAILEPKVIPGACWPMQGSRGHVTIRLPYPIKVETFSVDHVPWNIIPEDMFESAPKKMKVIAYPPCEEPESCGAIGFDTDDFMEIGQFNYDVDGPSVQTFDSIFVPASLGSTASKETPDNDEFGAEEEEESCSQEAAACSTPPKIDVAAITLRVLENHGNDDFTCIYRFRVHGEQVI